MKIHDIKKLPLVTPGTQNIDGMTEQAHFHHEQMKYDPMLEESGISSKKFLIPSFGTTSRLFS